MKGSRSIGNGGSTSRYVWTQTLEEVTVHVPIPDGLRAKDLVVLDLADEGGGGGGTNEDIGGDGDNPLLDYDP